MGEWMDGWMGGWVGGKAGLRIAYSNQKWSKLIKKVKINPRFPSFLIKFDQFSIDPLRQFILRKIFPPTILSMPPLATS